MLIVSTITDITIQVLRYDLLWTHQGSQFLPWTWWWDRFRCLSAIDVSEIINGFHEFPRDRYFPCIHEFSVVEYPIPVSLRLVVLDPCYPFVVVDEDFHRSCFLDFMRQRCKLLFYVAIAWSIAFALRRELCPKVFVWFLSCWHWSMDKWIDKTVHWFGEVENWTLQVPSNYMGEPYHGVVEAYGDALPVISLYLWLYSVCYDIGLAYSLCVSFRHSPDQGKALITRLLLWYYDIVWFWFREGLHCLHSTIFKVCYC